MTTTATEARSVVVEREIHHPPEKIWRALTEPHLIEEWLMKTDFKPVADHKFRFSGDWGAVDCEVIKIEPLRTLAYSWAAHGSTASSPGRSPRRAKARACAWSNRASARIRGRHSGAPTPAGSSSLPNWSRSWRGRTDVCSHN